MASLLPPITTAPVELVAVDDTALDWSKTDKPTSAVVEFEHAPLKGAEMPDVYVCRPLTATEKLTARYGYQDGNAALSMTSVAWTGLLEIRPAGAEPVRDRARLWQMIETHQLPQAVFLGLGLWIWEASGGDSEGRRFRAAAVAVADGAA